MRSKLAEPGERVEGLIICHDAEPSLQYALSAVPDVRLMRYTIEFHLTDMSGPD